MALLCSQCGEPVKAGDKTCPNPNCGEPLDVRSVFKRLLEQLGFRFARATAVRCPVCNVVGSLKVGYCYNCGCGFTLAAALAPLLRGPRRLWDRLTEGADNPTKWTFRRYYFWFSLVLFFATLSVYEKVQPEKGIATILLAVVYLPLLLVLGIWLKPRPKTPVPGAKKRTTPKITKLTLVFNYFTFLLVMELAMAAWLQKAIIIAIQCGVTVVAWFVFITFLWPVWTAMGIFFQQQSDDAQFDPTSYQGRRARSDHGGRRT